MFCVTNFIGGTSAERLMNKVQIANFVAPTATRSDHAKGYLTPLRTTFFTVQSPDGRC